MARVLSELNIQDPSLLETDLKQAASTYYHTILCLKMQLHLVSRNTARLQLKNKKNTDFNSVSPRFQHVNYAVAFCSAAESSRVDPMPDKSAAFFRESTEAPTRFFTQLSRQMSCSIAVTQGCRLCWFLGGRGVGSVVCVPVIRWRCSSPAVVSWRKNEVRTACLGSLLIPIFSNTECSCRVEDILWILVVVLATFPQRPWYAGCRLTILAFLGVLVVLIVFPKNLGGCGTRCPGSGCVGLPAGRSHAVMDVMDDIVMVSSRSSRDEVGGVAVKGCSGGALVVLRKLAWCFGVIAAPPCVFCADPMLWQMLLSLILCCEMFWGDQLHVCWYGC